MKYILLIIVIILFTRNNLSSQTVDRRYNPHYTWTTFHEDFSGAQLDRKVWKPTTHFKRGLGFLVDNPQTIKVKNDHLLLSMRKMSSRTDSLWTPTGWKLEHSDYVGGEVNSIRKFQYGIFECKAKYAHKKGSWPAFWLFGDTQLPSPIGNIGNEIDIAELARKGEYPEMMHVIHYYQPSKDTGITDHVNPDKKIYSIPRQQKYYTFKCIWTPQKIQYFIDNELKHEVINNKHEWYPKLPMMVFLSQQAIQADDTKNPKKLKAPQTSLFDWVTVREFFLAPEIDCPPEVARQATATLDADSLATNITWKLIPSTLFTKSEGIGKSVTITRAVNSKGPGKIIYTFSMPSGETFSAEKDFN